MGVRQVLTTLVRLGSIRIGSKTSPCPSPFPSFRAELPCGLRDIDTGCLFLLLKGCKMERFELLPGAPEWLLPNQPYDGDAGWDLRAWLPDGPIMMQLHYNVKLHTGVRIYLNRGEFGRILPRSSRPGILVNGGVVDSGYEGELIVTLTRVAIDSEVRVEPGDKIAQLVIQPYVCGVLPRQLGSKAPVRKRGDKGHGSSGR